MADEALRELLAKFEVEVEGTEQLEANEKQVKKNTRSMGEYTSALKDVTVAGTAFGQFLVDNFGKLKTATLLMFGLAKSGSVYTAVIQRVTIALTGLGLAFGSKAAFGFTKEVAAAVDETGKLASTLGISTKAVQEWSTLAEESGGSTADISSAFRRLSANMFEAQRTAGPAREAFERLGVAFEDGEGELRPLEDVLLDSASAIGQLENNSDKLALSQNVLGRGVLKLIPGFKGSREEMAKLLQETGAAAGIIDKDFIESSEKFNDTLARSEKQSLVLKSVIATAFLPVFQRVVEWFIKAKDSVTGFLRETGLIDRWLKVGALAGMVRFLSLITSNIGAVNWLFTRMIRILMPLLRIVARFLILALIFDDIIVFLQGGNSLLGKWIDKLFGVGSAKKVLELIKTTFSAIQTVVGFLVTDIGKLISELFSSEKAIKDVDTAFDGWTGVAKDILEPIISGLKTLFTWLDKVTQASDIFDFMSQKIFEAEDHAANQQALADAAARQRAARANAGAAGAPRAPQAPGATAGGKTTNVTDQSVTTVNLNTGGGPATPGTVRAAGQEAAKIKSRGLGAQNALVRGGT